jgi:hypothetical protein
MTDVIADLRREMQERLSDIERELSGLDGLVRERERLQAALAQPPFAAADRPAPAAARAPRRATARKSAKPRAPRGANLEAILKAVGDRPGVTASTIADVTKISRAVTYNTLAKLVEQSKIEKTELPGGQTGYKTAAPSL